MIDAPLEWLAATATALVSAGIIWRFLRPVREMAQEFFGRPPTPENPRGQLGLFNRMDQQDAKADTIDAKVDAVVERVIGLEETVGVTQDEIRVAADKAAAAVAEARRLADSFQEHKGEVAAGMRHLADQLEGVRESQAAIDVTQLWTTLARAGIDRRETSRDDGTGGET